MKDAQSDTRQAAASALVEINDPRVTSALLAALKEHDIPVIASTYFFFIHHGEPGSEDALIQALDTYGNKSMAESFLNCGNGSWNKPQRTGQPRAAIKSRKTPQEDRSRDGEARDRLRACRPCRILSAADAHRNRNQIRVADVAGLTHG